MNDATSTHPAYIIFLVDISHSMGVKMSNGKRRVDVVQHFLFQSIQEMAHRSTDQEIMKSRYKISLLVYSEEFWEAWTKLIDEIVPDDIPEFVPQTATDPANAFRAAKILIEEEISTWNETYLEKCPAPMVIHISDAEITEGFEDPTEAARELMSVQVPDGNVLITNIYISEWIKPPAKSASSWDGYSSEDSTGDPFGDILLKVSSPIPEPYIKVCKTKGYGLKPGARMLFPGVSDEYIKAGFVMSGVSYELRPVVQEPRLKERKNGDN